MSDLREVRTTNDPFTYWANSVKDTLREKNIAKSSDILLSSTNAGTYMSLHPKYKYSSPYMNYRGEWDASNSYSPNDVVRVLPNKQYKLPITKIITSMVNISTPSFPVSVGDYAAANGKIIQVIFRGELPMAGSYICVSSVPSFTTLPELHSVNAISFDTSGWLLSSDLLINRPIFKQFLNYVRLGDINYWPIWPETSSVAVIDPEDLTKTRGRYWELISQLPTKTNMCTGGNVVVTYIDSGTAPSGSMYPLNTTVPN